MPQPPPGTALVSAHLRLRSPSAALRVNFGRRNFAFHGVVRSGGAGENQNLDGNLDEAATGGAHDAAAGSSRRDSDFDSVLSARVQSEQSEVRS